MSFYQPFELHAHTFHSDGSFSPLELCENARNYQLKGIAITDHNTLSALEELKRESVPNGLIIVSGIEWTTFFGHMVVLGAEKYVDWRYAVPDTIDAYLHQIHQVNGVVGVAHPFELGSPMCTGCHWDFQVKDWSLVDYIEVWSKPNPTKQFDNELAYALWTERLNQGYHIAATAGRDWHREPETPAHTGATYIGLSETHPENPVHAVRDAIRQGRTYVTAGPELHFSLHDQAHSYDLGDIISAGSYVCRIEVNSLARREIWEPFGVKIEEIQVIANGSLIAAVDARTADQFNLPLSLQPGWVRMEAFGTVLDQVNQRIGFTSPIYIQPS